MPNPPAEFQPIQILIIDVDQPLHGLSGIREGESTQRYHQAMLFIRMHDEPLGSLQLEIPDGGLSAESVADAIWAEFGATIRSHLEADALPSVDGLTANGFERPQSLPCWSIVDDGGPLPMVSIVIPTRDREHELERVLRTLLLLEGPEFEVIIVDNAAKTDATRQMVAKHFANDERVRYVSQSRPGISPARNRGVVEAKGEIVAFTDDDVVVDRHWLRAIVRAARKYPQADAISGPVLPAEFETQPQLWFEEFGGFNKGFSPRVFTKEPQPGDRFLYPYTAGSYGSGNNIAFWTESVRAMGGFDEQLGVGSPTRSGEDLDMYLRIILDGGMIVYEPAAIISHFHRSDYDGLRKQLFNYGVGLSAVYTKWLLKQPISILRRVPQGLWYLLSPSSGKNEQRSTAFPKEMGRAELRGMLRGPFAYAKTFALRR